MFEYTCPGCRTKSTAKSIDSGTVTACRACGRQMRVVVNEEEDAGESSAPVAASGNWMSPWLVVAGGLPGLVGAALIVGLWFAFGRAPASAEAGPVAMTKPPAENRTVPPAETVKAPPPADIGKAPPEPKAKEEEKDPPIDIGPDPVPMSGEKIYNRLLKSCVWVIATDGTSTWTGSGAVIDAEERLVVTNEHVARGEARLAVLGPAKSADGQLIRENKYYWDEFNKGHAIPAKRVRVDQRRDLALIQLDKLPAEAVAVRVGNRPPNPGQKVYTIGGNPGSNQGQWISSDGSVRQVSTWHWRYKDGYPREGEVIASNVAINGGDSGGPLVDGRCVLVGVNNGGVPGEQLNSLHISVTEVRDFIAGYFRDTRKEWREPPEPSAEALAGVSVAKLTKALEGRSAKTRERAARSLANLGPAARAAVPALLKALRNTEEDDPNRAVMAMALSEIGPPDKAAVADLQSALHDTRCKEARRYAADALGKLGDGAKGAAAALVPALKDDDQIVRRYAAASLGRLGPAARDEAFDSLYALLRDPEAEVRKAAMGALMKMGKPPTDVTTLKAQAADSTLPYEARDYAVLALQMFPNEAVAALLDILATEKDPLLAGDAAFVLGHIKARSREVGAALAKALEPGKDKYVRVSAAYAIRDIGLDQQTLPAFMKALDSPEEAIRNAALAGMTNISTFLKGRPTLTLTKEAIPILVPGLSSPQPVARLFAAFGLSSLRAEAAPAVPDLRAALSKEQNMDPKFSPMIRLELLAALAEIGPAALPVLGKDADKFLDELKDVANDTDDLARQHRTCAALALGKIAPDKQSKATFAVLVKAMRLPNFNKTPHNPIDDELSERAAKALVKAGKFAADTIAKTCYAQFAWHAEDSPQTKLEKEYACRKTFEVLEKIGPEAACRSVKELLQLAKANPNEAAEVKAAATSAYFAVYGKK